MPQKLDIFCWEITWISNIAKGATDQCVEYFSPVNCLEKWNKLQFKDINLASI